MPERGPVDSRMGSGQPRQQVEMPTLLRPGDCMCTWTVVTPGPGLASISRLKYRNAQCRHRHQPVARGGT